MLFLLLHQIMGTDLAKERFPSTSTAKTTVHETEVILQEGPYCAVVTFFPMEDVREHLKECVSAAVLAAYRSESDSDQMRRLLTHVNQRFRFNYILGNGPVKDASDFDDDGNGDIDPESGDLLKRTNDVLSSALASVKDSVKEIAARYGAEDRDAFIASISRFASNYAPLFGTLLTPLVNGVRVSGPFYPAWTTDKPKRQKTFSPPSAKTSARSQKGRCVRA